MYYSTIPVDAGDKLVVTTQHGITTCNVTSVIDVVNNKGNSKQSVLENRTKNIYEKGTIVMTSVKIVEVQHDKSNRMNILYTDLDVKLGSTVVYESDNGMHVGMVIDMEPEASVARHWIVDVVDMATYTARVERSVKASKIKARLDHKRKQFQDIELLRLIAANDKETEALLAEYIELIG